MYCTLTDVEALNPKRIYGTSTTPTSTQVKALITQVAVEIDAILEAQGYTVPVTTPANLVNFLKYVNAYGAAYLAESGMFPETTSPGETAHWQLLKKIYDDYMKMLMESKTPAGLGVGADVINVGSFYTEMNTPSDFPDPAFRVRSEDRDY